MMFPLGSSTASIVDCRCDCSRGRPDTAVFGLCSAAGASCSHAGSSITILQFRRRLSTVSSVPTEQNSLACGGGGVPCGGVDPSACSSHRTFHVPARQDDELMHQKHRPEADARPDPGARFEFGLPAVRAPAQHWAENAQPTATEEVLTR